MEAHNVGWDDMNMAPKKAENDEEMKASEFQIPAEEAVRRETEKIAQDLNQLKEEAGENDQDTRIQISEMRNKVEYGQITFEDFKEECGEVMHDLDKKV